MKKILLLIFTVSFCMGSLSAQSFYGKINPTLSKKSNSTNSIDSLKILCVLVEFQEDKFDQTYGNGKFGTMYSKDYGSEIIDPLPHDETYFSNHLLFAKNYFRKVSNSKLNLDYDFLPGIITVSKPMREYSPDQDSEDFTQLGNFSKEVWQLADQNNAGFDFSKYDLFFIFHAGVGRDIVEPTGDFGRRDLPSVYLSDNQLKKIFGETFTGFPVQNNSKLITNSAILPETESREYDIIGGTTLLELSINGLLVATIASHLGLPDLYDTETGKTAIGRFGLMDGQSFFAYGGLFPPEPSPWEKIYLGWEEPYIINTNNQSITLTASKIAQANDVKILKVPLNSSEYYLLENRKRDANKDGAIITYISNGETKTKTFAKDDTSGFSIFSIEALEGVIIDIDEYDWAVPGFEDDQTLTDPFEDVGIVIWHIDENIINSKISINKINADPENKGIKIVEADGIVDIGEEFQSLIGDVIVGEGTRQDTWYKSNPSEYYENEFTPNSKPNTNSNTGGNSLISFDNFSTVDNKMTFDVSFGSAGIELLNSQEILISGEVESIQNIIFKDDLYTILVNNVDLQIYKNGTLLNSIFSFGKNKIATSVENNNLIIIGGSDTEIKGVVISNNSQREFSKSINSAVSSQIIIYNMNSQIYVSFGTNNGNLEIYSLLLNDPIQFDLVTVENIFNTLPIRLISYNENDAGFISNNIAAVSLNNTISFTNQLQQIANVSINNSTKKIILDSENKFYTTDNSEVISEFALTELPKINSFSLADLFNDGNIYITFVSTNNLYAYNTEGSLAEGFPKTINSNAEFVGTPFVVDLDKDNKAELLTFLDDGRIIGFDPDSKNILDGFNISSGAQNINEPSIISDNGNMYLSLVNKNNYLYTWKFSDVGEVFWGDQFGNSQNLLNVKSPLSNNKINEFFPEDNVYNWPNPVNKGNTFIRYYVSEDSKIDIKIFDLAGDLVAEFVDNAAAGVDNETAWNVDEIQSGVYFARVEATSNSGKTSHKIIKIAVIK